MDLNGENQFFFGRVVDGGEALVFINVEALQALVDAIEAHMDGTFHSKPRGFYQLATLHAVAYGKVSRVSGCCCWQGWLL